MKYIKKILLVLLAFSLVSALAACGPSLLELDGGLEASFVGYMVQMNDEYAALSDVYPGENYLELYNDNTGVIAFSGFEEPLTWTKDGSKITLTFQNEPSEGTLEGGILSVNIEGAIVTYIADGVTSPMIPSTQAPNYDSDPSTAYGTYQGLSVSYENSAVNMVEYYKGDCSITLDSDGMGKLILGGSVQTIAWEIEDNILTIADSNGINSFGILEDGVLVLDYMESGLQLAFAKEGFEP